MNDCSIRVVLEHWVKSLVLIVQSGYETRNSKSLSNSYITIIPMFYVAAPQRYKKADLSDPRVLKVIYTATETMAAYAM